MTDLRLEIEPGAIPSDKDIELHFDEQARELGLRYSLHNRQDYKELFRILNVYLSYPDSALAAKHREANRLGELDRKKQRERNLRQTYIRVENEICNCCGFFIQKEELSNCEEGIVDVNGLGSSTVVFFQTFKNIAILLALMVVTYSVFAFATNISVAQESTKGGSLDYLSISLGAKAKAVSVDGNADTYYLVSSWLGVCMLVFWLVALLKMKGGVASLEAEAKGYTSVSDFSVVVEKMPTGFTRDQVQAMMDEYFTRIAPPDVEFRQLKVEKYNEAKPFYFNEDEFNDPELDQACDRLREIRQEMIEWIAERVEEEDFSSTAEYREVRAGELADLTRKVERKKEEIIQKIVRKLEEKDKQTTTFVFITFETIQQRDFFLAYNSNALLSRLKHALPCFDKSHRFSISDERRGGSDERRGSRSLVVQTAPEPEDINWGNIGFGECESAWRKCVTALATLVVLGISFVIVYGLSTVQNQRSEQRFLSIFISLVISVINLVMTKVIQFTTVFEKHYTNNAFQISLAYKSILAQLLNSVLVPLIVSLYIKSDNVYGQSGLTQDIFILAITNSFIPPLVRLVDPYFLYLYLRYHYYNRPLNKIGLNQYELNLIAEKPEHELGLEYIYLISNFLFTCFFVSLQPVIPLFALLGLLLMFWVEKYALFNRSQRPVPGIDTINFVMHHLIYLGGAVYALGSLTWAVFLADHTFSSSLVPNLIAAGLGLLIFLFPYEAFTATAENEHLRKSYSERRIYFPAEYDRLNPVTKREGVREYREFLLRKKQEIEGLSAPIQDELAAKLLQLTQNNTHKPHMGGKPIFGRNQTAEVAQQIFLNETRNIVDPKLLKSFLLPHSGRDRNLDLYASSLDMMMKRNFSHGDIVEPRDAAEPRDTHVAHTLANSPYEKEVRVSAFKDCRDDYAFAEKNREDNFNNLYKSTLNLSQLGIASNQERRSHQHPQPPNHRSSPSNPYE